MNATDMEKTLSQIAEMATLVYSKESFWAVQEMILMPPAEDKDIQALSKECPFPLPPSYIQFLQLHDGCLNFWPGFALLGTKGEPKAIVSAEVADAREFLRQFVADASGNITAESVARFEAPTDVIQQFFLPLHIIFGTNQGGEFFIFNEKKQTAEGEYEAIHYEYSGGAYARYPDFPSFLAATVEELEKRIKEKRYAKKK